MSPAQTVESKLLSVGNMAIDPKALERARAAMPSKEEMERLFKIFEDMPEPKCSKCGRVIYCGVNSLCKEKDCGLK